MSPVLTFIIPVRHQDNAGDWDSLKRNLTQTIRSIASQRESGWQAIIVANEGADLPELPPGFSVARVTFPPNQLHSQGNATKEDFYEACRADKGRRVLAGLLQVQAVSGGLGHVMIVDDDDFVSNRLAGFVAANAGANGWYLRDGYVWNDGGGLLYRSGSFCALCGTSHIVRGDLYNLPSSLETADETYIRRWLGSHIFIDGMLAAAGAPLAPLPFAGAVYRIGHAGAHSRSTDIMRYFFRHRWLLKKPWELCRRLLNLRWKTAAIEREFFGNTAHG